jgi:hypothetical protein
MLAIVVSMPRRPRKKNPDPNVSIEVVHVAAPDAKERVAQALAIVLRAATKIRREDKDGPENSC